MDMSRRSQNTQSPSPSILSDTGPSQILPFLYVGSQEDAISKKTVQDIHITHVINVSTTGDRAPFLNENDSEHFLRIPVNDCLTAQLLLYFDKTYAFIEKARLNNGRILIHCLAGISRSPAIAIAYIIRYLHLSADDALNYVKQRRSQIAPNFNFLGQLSEYEKTLSITSPSITTPIVKCVAIETSFVDRRRFVQVEGCSNTNNQTIVLTRPKTLISSATSTIDTNSSIKTPEHNNSLKPKLSRPTNISLQRLPLELINSTSEEVNDTKQTEKVPKSTNATPLNGQNNLINTYFDGSSSSTSSDEWKSAQSTEATGEKTNPNVLNSSLEVLVL